MSYLRIFVFLIIIVSINKLNAQLAIKHGNTIPATDTLKVLIVFAEVDYSTGGCPLDLPDNIIGNWPNKNGKTQIPLYANDFFDYKLKNGQKPKGYITDYYHEASFGKYVLLGDYLPVVLTIPCNELKMGFAGFKVVLNKLNKLYPKDSTLYTKHGFSLNDFDNWTITNAGIPKIKEPDGRIDLLYIIWKNNRFISNGYAKDNSGYGVNKYAGVAFKNMLGTNNISSFNSGFDANHAQFITIAEHLHGIMSGNHWHTAGGRSNHTFLACPHSYGLTGQSYATMQAPCGWDRWIMDWKNPEKKFIVSALDNSGIENNTEEISLYTHPEGGTYILRDFMKTGDAIRIKLPYINWQKKDDIKNQYLWIENRQMNTRFDLYYGEKCADAGNYPNGTPGIYMYIQVGKDKKEGDYSIYSAYRGSANGLASHLFPITAEGNYDFYYDYDNIQEKQNIGCNWNNKNIPIDLNKSLKNPFTGFSDLYQIIDIDKNGKLYNNDKGILIGLSEIKNGKVVHNFNSSGDWEDAFGFATGKTKLCLSSNPAPVPVYTLTTNYEYNIVIYDKKNKKPYKYENRTIWLNGLSIEIIDEGLIDGEAIKVQIKWDDYTIKNDVRWCGNIVLSPHVFLKNMPSLKIEPTAKVLLDRGLSPTWWGSTIENGKTYFTDTTIFTCIKDTYIQILPFGNLEIKNGSKLILQSGSKMVLEADSKVLIEKGCAIIVEKGAILEQKNGAQIVGKEYINRL